MDMLGNVAKRQQSDIPSKQPTTNT